jgi:hypothetical protein
VSPGTGCVPVWSGQLSPNFPKQIGGVGRKTSEVGFYAQKKGVSFHSSPQKTRLRLFSEPGSGKSELGYETAIFFDGRTLRETGQIGSCGSRFDETETSVNKTTPVPITPRGPVVTLDTLKPFRIIIINNIILSDAMIGVLIFQRLL